MEATVPALKRVGRAPPPPPTVTASAAMERYRFPELLLKLPSAPDHATVLRDVGLLLDRVPAGPPCSAPSLPAMPHFTSASTEEDEQRCCLLEPPARAPRVLTASSSMPERARS